MEYLIVDYSGITKEDFKNEDFSNKKYFVVDESELFEFINKSKDKEKFPEIAVFKLGDCLIDWS